MNGNQPTFDDWLRHYLKSTGQPATVLAWWARCSADTMQRFLSGRTDSLKAFVIHNLMDNRRVPDCVKAAIREAFLGIVPLCELTLDLNRDGRVDSDDLAEAHEKIQHYVTIADGIGHVLAK